MNFDQINVPDWVNWVAQDANGVIWGYEVEPLQHYQGWYENEIGRSIKLDEGASNIKWRNTLRNK